MLRDSRYRLAHVLPLVDEHGLLMSSTAAERRVRLVEHRPMPVLKTAIALTVSELIELELKGKSAWFSYLRSVTYSTSVARMWLAFISEQLKSGNDLEKTERQWSIVRRILRSAEALYWLFVSCQIILVRI